MPQLKIQSNPNTRLMFAKPLVSSHQPVRKRILWRPMQSSQLGCIQQLARRSVGLARIKLDTPGIACYAAITSASSRIVISVPVPTLMWLCIAWYEHHKHACRAPLHGHWPLPCHPHRETLSLAPSSPDHNLIRVIFFGFMKRRMSAGQHGCFQDDNCRPAHKD